MALFDFNAKEPLSFNEMYKGLEDLQQTLQAEDLGLEATRSLTVSGSQELANQFIVFQLSSNAQKDTILESSKVDPIIQGDDENPDMLVSINMLSFHIGAQEDIDKDTRATMRIVMGKDENSRDRVFETVYWTISAGLDLYDQIKKKPAEPRELKADFIKALGNRPIEIPGGLATLSFDVVKHTEPKWWQKIFSFLQTGEGQALTSVIGFPAITSSAIGVLDELLNRLERSKPDILFGSRPMTLALSASAKQDYTAGNPRIKLGTLNPGFCVLTRGRDFPLFADTNAYYLPTYGKLIPEHISPEEAVSGRFEDPFKNATYAVFRVRMQPTKLDPTFNYG